MHIIATPNQVYALVTAIGLIAAIVWVLFDVLRQIKRTIRESYLLATDSDDRNHWPLLRAIARLAVPAILIAELLRPQWVWRAVAPSPGSAWFDKPIENWRDAIDTVLVGARAVLWAAAQLEIAFVIVVVAGAAVVLLVRTELPTEVAAAFGRAVDSLRSAVASLRGQSPVAVAVADSGVRPE